MLPSSIGKCPLIFVGVLLLSRPGAFAANDEIVVPVRRTNTNDDTTFLGRTKNNTRSFVVEVKSQFESFKLCRSKCAINVCRKIFRSGFSVRLTSGDELEKLRECLKGSFSNIEEDITLHKASTPIWHLDRLDQPYLPLDHEARFLKTQDDPMGEVLLFTCSIRVYSRIIKS